MEIANHLNYIGENQDWVKFIGKVSSNTGTKYEGLWLENAKANKQIFREHGWAAEAFQGIHKGKTTVLLGASPAIKNQIEKLKELREDPDFIFIGVSSGLEYLLKQGLHPHYMMVADADPNIERFWRDTDFNETKDITLITNLCTHPNILERWKGDIKFLAIWTTIKKLDKKFSKWFSPLNGCGQYFAGLMSQFNTAAAVAFTIFESEILIFVGNELSFKNESSRYYVDREDVKDRWLRAPHLDIYGKKVLTNHMLLSLKMSLEDFLGKLSGVGWFFNCTEAGIFGVTKRHGNLPWIHQLNLTTGIAQARQIMRTGEPFYL